MSSRSNLIRGALLAALAFLSLTAVTGGLGLITGLVAPPVEMLTGSVFQTFLVPGLVLMLVVGGSAALALRLVHRASRRASLAALFASAAIIGFELVEVAVVGSPQGPSRVMQVFYVCLGIVIALLALAGSKASEGSDA